MKRLSENGVASARSFLRERARPLEQALAAHELDGTPGESVLRDLDTFRNQDGGYGHALESDSRSADSSILATTEALAIMAELDVEEGHQSLDDALAWTLSSASGFNPDTLIWPYLPPGLDDAPHAPWWNIETLEQTFGGFLVNPRARILAFLWRWPGAVAHCTGIPVALLDRATREVLDWCAAAPDEASPDTLRSLVMLADAPGLPPHSAAELAHHVERMIPASVVTDPAKWGEYGLQPTEVAASPDSRWLPLLAEAVERHLDHIVDSQAADGSWKPFWSWGGVYPQAWEVAREEWAGVLTVRRLRVLKGFGRIAG